MNAFVKLTWMDAKLFLRNYIASFFMFIFPLIMLVMFGAMYGNTPAAIFGGRGAMDVSVPGYIAALVIGTAAFMNLPGELTMYRERGILRRYRATPIRPGWVLGSQMLVTLGATLLGTLLLVVLGVLVFHLHLPDALIPTFLGFLLACLSLFSSGFLIASLIRSANTARAVGMVIFYPMMFLSGGTLPREVMPAAMQRVSDFLPLTYAVNLIKGLWFGKGWDMTAVAVLVVLAVVGVIVSIKMFRWE